MSKILKVVDGKHYVQGGPVCEWRRGISQRFCVGGKITYPGIKWRPCPGPDYISDEDCSACHGTGLLAVELWPDARLDEFLNEHFDAWDLQMRREMHTNNPIYAIAIQPGETTYPCDDNSRGAKIAAVIAVAEEQEWEVVSDGG